MAEEPKVEPVVNQEIPRTKSDWEKLAKENPTRFAELSQPRIDELTRKEREANEKLDKERQEKQNLLVELESYKQKPQIQIPVPNQSQTGDKVYGPGQYPDTKQEWDDLFLTDPTFATDLRSYYFNEQNKRQEINVTEQKKSVKVLSEEHPDMYIFELDENSQVKKDSKGKPINKIDSNGWPIFNPNSEKGKLWVELFNEEDAKAKASGRINPFAVPGSGPRLLMAEMERSLRQKGATVVNQAQSGSDSNDYSGLAPQGVTPPKESSLKFNSEEERALAQKRVNAGVYKSLEDFCNWRDKGAVTFDHSNSRPDFSKK